MLTINPPTVGITKCFIDPLIAYNLASKELITNSLLLKQHPLARLSSSLPLSATKVKEVFYEASTKTPILTLSKEPYPQYSLSNWSQNYTESFYYYQELLETKRLFRQGIQELSSELSSFIDSSTHEYIEAIEWKIQESLAPILCFSKETPFPLLIRNAAKKHLFSTVRLFSINELYHKTLLNLQWAFTEEPLKNTPFLSLSLEIPSEPIFCFAPYSTSLVNSYLEEQGFTPMEVLAIQDSSSADYKGVLFAIESDLARNRQGKNLSLIRLFPISDQFYTQSLQRSSLLERCEKTEIASVFLSSDFLDNVLILQSGIQLDLIPASIAFPLRYKKIENIHYLSSLDFQSIFIDFLFTELSLQPQTFSHVPDTFCLISTYKGEDILQEFILDRPFSSSWSPFFSLQEKYAISSLKAPMDFILTPFTDPSLQEAKLLFTRDTHVNFELSPKIDALYPSLQYTPISSLAMISSSNSNYHWILWESFSGVENMLIPEMVNPLSLFFQTATFSFDPSQESLETAPLFTHFSIGENYSDVLMHLHSEFYIPFIDKNLSHFFSYYGMQEIPTFSMQKEDLVPTPSFSPDIVPTYIKGFSFSKKSTPSPLYQASLEKAAVPLYFFLAKGNLTITTYTSPLENDRYPASLIRILPPIELLETTPFDPLFLSGNASIEINRAHRMIYTELSTIPSLAELDTDCLNDDFLIEAKVTPQMNEGYLFSLKIKEANIDFLTPEKHHLLFIVDRSATVEKHRYDIYKKSLLQSLTYLDSNALFNIYFFDSTVEKMSPHDLKPTKTASLLAQKFLQNSPQVKGSSFADFISLMQEIKKTAALSNDVYSVILLSNGSYMKNIRFHRDSLKELIQNWPDSLSLYTTAISDNNNIPMLELLAKVGKGELSLAKTHSAFGRKLCTLIRRISKPIAHGISITALSEDPKLSIEFSAPFSSQLFADRSFSLYGKSSTLCNIDLLVQAKREDRYIQIRKRLSLKNAEKGKSSIEKEFYSHLALHELISFIFSNDQTHLLKAKNYLSPFDSSLTSQL
jgi:hypothetical protein